MGQAFYFVSLQASSKGIGCIRSQSVFNLSCSRAKRSRVYAGASESSHMTAGGIDAAGMHLQEELSFRVKDVEFELREIIVREGKD